MIDLSVYSSLINSLNIKYLKIIEIIVPSNQIVSPNPNNKMHSTHRFKCSVVLNYYLFPAAIAIQLILQHVNSCIFV